MVEGESRTLFTLAVMHIFSHLHLRDPSFNLGALLEPVAPKLHDDAAEAVEKQVEALLQKFLCVDPTTSDSGEDGGGVVDNEPPRRATVASKAEAEVQRRRFIPF